jgi:hypothetical protein
VVNCSKNFDPLGTQIGETAARYIYDRAMSACVSPASRRASASFRWNGVSLRGRPNLTPRS